MLQAWSQTEAAHRDTLILGAKEESLRRLSSFYGLPRPVRPSALTDFWWRRALRQGALGPRGLFGLVRAFLDEVTGPWRTDVAVTTGAPFSQRLTAASGAPFLQDHVGREVLYSGKRYRVEGPQDVAGAGGTYLVLSRAKTNAYAQAIFTAIGSPTSGTATILPYVIEEPSPGHGAKSIVEACLLRVRLFISDLSTAPPTYLLGYATPVGSPPPNPDPTLRPTGMPKGGLVLTDEFAVGNQTVGPFPLYLAGDATWETLRLLLEDLVPAGVRVETVIGWKNA